jgi:hypothetical protein
MIDQHRSLVRADSSFLGPHAIAPDPAIAQLLSLLLTDERDLQGARILREQPSIDERQMLRERLLKLQASLHPGRSDQIAAVVGQLMLGFGTSRTMGENDALATAAQYVAVLAPLPLWAIREGCMRFARGGVSKSECPGWNASFPPSAPQLYRLAQSLVSPFYKEMSEIDAVLNGVVIPGPTEAERAQRAKELGELAESIRARAKEEDAQMAKQFAELSETMRAKAKPDQGTAFQATKAAGLKPLGPSVTSALAKALAEKDELDKYLANKGTNRPQRDDTVKAKARSRRRRGV